jgi:hypothetical protein
MMYAEPGSIEAELLPSDQRDAIIYSYTVFAVCAIVF